MVELRGPDPDEMKPGEIYKVEKDGDDIRLVIARSTDGQTETKALLEIRLSEFEYRVLQLQATKKNIKADEFVQETIKDLLDQIYDDGVQKY